MNPLPLLTIENASLIALAVVLALSIGLLVLARALRLPASFQRNQELRRQAKQKLPLPSSREHSAEHSGHDDAKM